MEVEPGTRVLVQEYQFIDEPPKDQPWGVRSFYLAKLSVLNTVHCDRLRRTRQYHCAQPQYWHCPRLFT